jgi:hypothetical protein
MATVQELQQELDALIARKAEINAKYDEVSKRANAARLDGTMTAALAAERNAAEQELKAIFSAVYKADQALQAAKAAAPPPPQPQPPDTASQAAKDDGPQGPNAAPEQKVSANGRVVTAPATTTPSNADTPATVETTGGDQNTDPAVKTQSETQAITNNTNSGSAVPDPGTDTEPTTTIQEGAAAPSDDAANNDTTTTQAEVNGSNNTVLKITPQPNVLDDYYSYTYVASVYLMSDTQYQRLITGKNKKIDGYQLLFQSGGAPNNVGGVRPPPPAPPDPKTASTDTTGAPSSNNLNQNYPDGGRNPFFDNDFYIDQITLETVPCGKGTGASHMNAALKFNVIEPMGITLIDRLYKAVSNFSPRDATGKINYSSAVYLMVIRFYGYDEEGVLQNPIRGGLQSPDGKSDPRAVVEKFIPFQIKAINWSVGSKLVNYEWDCVPIGQLQGGYTARGTIPYDVQLVDSTVGGLLSGPAKYSPTEKSAANPGASSTPAAASGNKQQSNAREEDTTKTQAGTAANTPPKATAAPTPKKTITNGLMGAMNDFQEELVKKGIYDIPDFYEIEFLPGIDSTGKVIPATAISDAKLQLPNAKVDKAKTAAGAPPSQDGGKALDQTRQSVDMVSRSFSITAGQQILQAIELAIRNSSYITDQALVIINPDGTQSPNPNSKNKPMTWFTITMSATKQPGGIDTKRNDSAYRIKYSVAPFIVKNFNSKYFPVSKFSGVHKSYPFWFTGKNIAVKEYQENLNALYTLTVSGSGPDNSAATKTAQNYTSSMRDIVRYNYSPRSNQSSQGADGKTFEAAANAAEVLYSPGDLAEAKVKIIGDPAWIMQGSLFRPVDEGTFTGNQARTGFEPDGTISFDSQDILFEMVWQRPQDYDIDTGLADPFAGGTNVNREPLQSRVYYCTKVVSEFKNGAFEQNLTGSLYLFPKTDKTNTANPAAATSGAATAENNGVEGRQSTAGTSGTATSPSDKRKISSGLTAAQANNIRGSFAASDPRRLDLPNNGSAAILGSQQATPAGPTKVQATADQSASNANPTASPARQAAGNNTQLENTRPPRPANSNDGEVETSNSTQVSSPLKLPPAADSTGLSAEQTAAINQRLANRNRSTEAPAADTQAQNQKFDKEY